MNVSGSKDLSTQSSLLNAFRDQLSREIQIPFPPNRIISLVPSQTEFLFDLGLDEEVIAITKFCVHPEKWFRTKTRVGGTKQLHIDQIVSLQPDLIIANKEENVEEQINELAKHFPVWISDIKTLEDAYEMMKSVGEMVDRTNKASEIISKIKSGFSKLSTQYSKHKAAYFIWRDPLMTIGNDTFLNTMLDLAGFENVFSDRPRYPEVSISETQSRNPEFILLSSEPFPFKQKHIDELQHHFPSTRIVLVDGEMFSWYGSRLLKAPEYFQTLRSQLTTDN